MAQQHVHYEAAFQDFLRSRGWPYLPIDEQKKAIFSGARVKSFDFLVYPPGGKAWLVDVKGRKFPYEGSSGKRYWENWVPRADLDGLSRWDDAFGEGFQTGLIFAYWLVGPMGRVPTSQVHAFRGRDYAFLWISALDYATHARQRSPKWDTVSVPAATFRRLVKPLNESLASHSARVPNAAI